MLATFHLVNLCKNADLPFRKFLSDTQENSPDDDNKCPKVVFTFSSGSAFFIQFLVLNFNQSN